MSHLQSCGLKRTDIARPPPLIIEKAQVNVIFDKIVEILGRVS